jgi:adenosylhomocysteinase
LYIAKNYKNLAKDLHEVPNKIDEKVARVALSSFGIKIDKLTKEQTEYHIKGYVNY